MIKTQEALELYRDKLVPKDQNLKHYWCRPEERGQWESLTCAHCDDCFTEGDIIIKSERCGHYYHYVCLREFLEEVRL